MVRTVPRGQGCASWSGLCLAVRAVPRGQGCASWSGLCLVVRAVPRGQDCTSWSGLCLVFTAVPWSWNSEVFSAIWTQGQQKCTDPDSMYKFDAMIVRFSTSLHTPYNVWCKLFCPSPCRRRSRMLVLLHGQPCTVHSQEVSAPS